MRKNSPWSKICVTWIPRWKLKILFSQFKYFDLRNNVQCEACRMEKGDFSYNVNFFHPIHMNEFLLSLFVRRPVARATCSVVKNKSNSNLDSIEITNPIYLYIVSSSLSCCRSMKNGSRKKCHTTSTIPYIWFHWNRPTSWEEEKIEEKNHWNLNGTKANMRFDAVLWLYISCEIMFRLEFETSFAANA